MILSLLNMGMPGSWAGARCNLRGDGGPGGFKAQVHGLTHSPPEVPAERAERTVGHRQDRPRWERRPAGAPNLSAFLSPLVPAPSVTGGCPGPVSRGILLSTLSLAQTPRSSPCPWLCLSLVELESEAQPLLQEPPPPSTPVLYLGRLGGIPGEPTVPQETRCAEH